MAINELKVGQIRRAITRFSDYANDLLSSDTNTFDDRLNLLMEYCQTDSTISRIHHQLLALPGVDPKAWYASSRERRDLLLPTDLDQRLALQYQILLGFRSGQIPFLEFAVIFFPSPSNRIDDHIHAVNEAIVGPMVRELTYRLEDIVADLPTDSGEAVGLSVVQIITNTGTLVQQVAPGAQNAVMNSTVDSQQLRQLVEALRAAVARAQLEPMVKQEATDVVNAMSEEAQSASPRTAVLKGLLRALPRVAEIATIAAAIASMIGA